MNNKIKIFLILVGISAIILGVALNMKTEYNVYYNSYSNDGYIELDIPDNKKNRYNEKLNKTMLGYLVSTLDMIVNEENHIDNYGIVEYAMLYAEEYDYKFEENTKVVNNIKYIKVKYLNKVIKDLFNININISKEKFNIVDEYVEQSNTRNLVTSAFRVELDKILYNKEQDMYLAYIYSVSGEYEESINVKEKANYKIVIRYKKNSEGKYTILQYNKISI